MRVFVPGVPAAQGSKRHVGKGIMVESSKAVGPWRDRIQRKLEETLGDEHEPSRAAVVLNVRFLFLRPKAHLRVNGSPRESAPRLPAKRPDIDKLLRAVMDACKGHVFVDDGQVVTVNMAKEYGNVTGVELTWHTIA